MINGVDISNLNGLVNINLIKNQGNSFIIAKATEGSTFIDKYYNYNIEQAKDLELVAGAYHFARFQNKSKAIEEANFFKSIVLGAKPDFVVLDIEQQVSGDITEVCLAFLDIISTVAPTLIYCNPSYIKAHLNSNITKYPLWIAHYEVNSPSIVLWKEYAIWQYTEKGEISGINGYLDLNYMSEAFYNSFDTNQSVKSSTLIEQIKALQYNLNIDYNAKLTIDGIVGPATMAALEGIQDIIIKGHKSHAVLWIQQKLEQYGYLKENSYTQMLYDEATFQAVTELQKNWGRSTDGILKLQTWDIFLSN
ncbi:GH25 family lysozyme [Clostridium kluyveri]|uniref:Glycosyl hydrolase n=1 Tax=Clostridium kluyveri TaxID=1534 RepID=A0A1L5FBB5_CLOKL|nr:GH25 family lysozyme [Clostridium kluyveri]APM40110.1 glycosyl hydrolase [Clostridium kluyveri]UZQ49650.1 GH25 family lysozyme [Clostridium kluyveri]